MINLFKVEKLDLYLVSLSRILDAKIRICFFSRPRLSLAWRRWPTTTFPVFIAARACMNLRNFSAILVSRVPKDRSNVFHT